MRRKTTYSLVLSMFMLATLLSGLGVTAAVSGDSYAVQGTLHTAAAIYRIYVPDDFGTIQAALDKVADLYYLDSATCIYVIVRDGTYTGFGNKNLDFKGEELTLRSENGPANCVIDCENSGRGLRFHSGEASSSVVSGFTITNGQTSSRGGGVLCENSSPTITNCVISNSVASLEGGGIACTGSSPFISHCIINGNSVLEEGGGISCDDYSSPLIVNSSITGNTADGSSPQGGGIYVSGFSSPIIDRCLIAGNLADYGGGIHYSSNVSSQFLTNCVIGGNVATEKGGGVYSAQSFPTIANCLINDNTADEGGGIFCTNEVGPNLANCTFVDNTATTGGGFLSFRAASTSINCIFWENTATFGAEIALREDAVLDISYSDVGSGMAGIFIEPGSTLNPGAGNLAANPRFVNGPLGLYLSQHAAGQLLSSPCLDAGSDLAVNLGLNLNTTRTDHIGDLGIVDMGYHHPVLTQVNLDYPPDQVTINSSPTFCWTADGVTDNGFAVDFSIPFIVPLWSTYNNLHIVVQDSNWTMSPAIWGAIPPGLQIFWRVRGADLDRRPPRVVNSDEIWSLYKP